MTIATRRRLIRWRNHLPELVTIALGFLLLIYGGAHVAS